MSNRNLLLAPASLLILQAGVAQIHGAVEAYLKLDGITGESTDSNHKGWIEVESFSWGVSQTLNIGSATSGAGAGKVTFKPLVINKRLDSTSPTLFLACERNRQIATGILEVYGQVPAVQASGRTEIKLELIETINLDRVAIAALDNTGGDEQPQESLQFQYGTLIIVSKDKSNSDTLGSTAPVDTQWSTLDPQN